MRRLGVALAAGALVLAFAGIAQAGTLSRVGADLLRYDADPGETNRIFVSTDSEGVRVIDTGATVTAGAGCTTPAAHEGHCAANPGQTRLEINADDQDDYVDILPGTLNLAIVDGGTGEDELLGGGARSGNLLDGGPGAEFWRGERPPITTAGRIRSLSPSATTSPTTAKPARATSSRARSSPCSAARATTT